MNDIDSSRLISYIRDNGIEYVERGPDVAKDNVNIKCPFCGEDDTGMHMGINLDTGFYGCWRNSRHRGRDVSTLLREVTREPIYLIRRHIGMATVLSENDVSNMLDVLNQEERPDKKREKRIIGGVNKLNLDKTFRPLWVDDSYGRDSYIRYLKGRGFDNIDKLAYSYHLHYCLFGDWKHRIIFPVYYKHNLVSWIGRTINKNEPQHYLDLSVEKSVRHPKFCLYDYDYINNDGETLYITEGVIDCMKLGWYLTGRNRATCLFTNSMTDEQEELLWSVGKKYSDVVVLLDNDATGNALSIQSKLKPVIRNVLIGMVPIKYGDPGALDGAFIENGGLLNGRILHNEKEVTKS